MLKKIQKWLEKKISWDLVIEVMLYSLLILSVCVALIKIIIMNR